MPKRSPRPPDMPWLTPYITVKSPAAALAFYTKAFGFETKMTMDGPDGSMTHAEVRWHDAVIMIGPEGGGGGTSKAPVTTGVESPVGLYLYCDDVDALVALATSAGAKVSLPPQDMYWGDRMCKLLDPDGHAWSFATNVADFDPSKAPK